MQKNTGQIFPLFSKVVYKNIIDDLDFKKIINEIDEEFVASGYRTNRDVSNIAMSSVDNPA